MAEDNWVEAGGGTSDVTWDRESILIGKYIGSKSDVGPNKSMLYTIQTEDGNVGVWGSTVLDGRFEEVPMFSKVRLECLGKKTSKSGSQFTDFKVQYQPPKEEDLTATANQVFSNEDGPVA